MDGVPYQQDELVLTLCNGMQLDDSTITCYSHMLGLTALIDGRTSSPDKAQSEKCFKDISQVIETSYLRSEWRLACLMGRMDLKIEKKIIFILYYLLL